MTDQRENRLYWLFNLIPVAALIAIKIPTLNLPHYWDEAFPYSFAIGYMTEHGPGLLTTAAPADYTTGHPLLYHFSQSTWNLLVGETLWMQRILPLLISCGCLLITSLLGAQLFSRAVGVGAAFLLLTQSSFLANSTFQLPETLLTLLLLCTLYFLFTERKWLFVLASTLLLFVKEPGVILLLLIFLFHFFVLLSGKSFTERVKAVWIYAIPVCINLLFYLHQYAVQGWLLFPRHTGFMHYSFDFVFNQFSRYFSHLFIYSGRNALFFAALVFGAVNWWHQSTAWNKVTKGAALLAILVTGFLLFSAFNFYSNRYILCLFPLFMLLAAAALYYALNIRVKLYAAAVAILAGVTFFSSLTNERETDTSLGYANAVRCQQAAVRYCVDQQWQEKSIYAGFLMLHNLTSHYPRYVTKEEVFKKVNHEPMDRAEVVILTSIDMEHRQHPANMRLLRQFEEGKSWGRIYVR